MNGTVAFLFTSLLVIGAIGVVSWILSHNPGLWKWVARITGFSIVIFFLITETKGTITVFLMLLVLFLVGMFLSRNQR